jgi:hypothetical protein
MHVIQITSSRSVAWGEKDHMKRIIVLSLLAAMLLLAAPALAGKTSGCTDIQSGMILYSAGHYLAGKPITTGFDPFGYNYQAHMFSGSYANAYLGGYGYPPYLGDDAAYLAKNPKAALLWVWPYRMDQLAMKWNDAWISKTDCDDDGKLDRHYGYPVYIGSGAWLTNHMSGVADGRKWTYFTKIVAVPSDAVKKAGVWYSADGTEIGPVIWGEFAILQEVASGEGATYVSPSGPGLGNW